MNKISVILVVCLFVLLVAAGAAAFIHHQGEMKQLRGELDTARSEMAQIISQKVDEAVSRIEIPPPAMATQPNPIEYGLPGELFRPNFMFGGIVSFGTSSIFAVTGDKCPYGSTVYDGPEQAYALQEGVQYCNFYRRSITLDRRTMDKCPGNMIEVVDDIDRPDENMFFCRHMTGEEEQKYKKSKTQEQTQE